MMIKVVLVLVLFVANGWASVDLNPPPTCYETCLSQTLQKVGCQFSNLTCYCGASNTAFTGPLTGCAIVNCNDADQTAGANFLAGICAVLTSGQTTLPPSLATLVPPPTSSQTHSSTAPPSTTTDPTHSPDPSSTPTKTTSDPPTTSSSQPTISSTPTTITTQTTNAAGQVQTTSVVSYLPPPAPDESLVSKSTTSTATLIGAVVGGVLGFTILALLVMSVVLYILVRRSIERRQAKHDSNSTLPQYTGDIKHNPSQRSSVAASDSPEDEMSNMETSFWGVVTRPKQALRVVNG